MIEKLKFVPIELPILNQEIHVLAKELKELEGKTVCLDLTRDLKGKSVEAIFKLNVQGEKIIAKLVRLHVLPFFIRRMMRKGIDYVEDSFITNVKEDPTRIKFFLITRKKVHRSIRNALRIKAKEEIIQAFKDKATDQIFTELLEGRFQKGLSLKLKKIYPLTFCEIRDIFLEKKQ